MFKGHVDKVGRKKVAGWAMHGSGIEKTDVIIYVNGQRWAEIACCDPRPDLSALGPLEHYNHGFSYEFSPELPSGMEIRIAVRDRRTGRLLSQGEVTLPAEPAEAALTPILVTAVGRSGTTLLMGKLAQSADIVVAEAPPYEIRLLSYYATAQFVLTSLADTVRSTHPDRLEGRGFEVGFNPFSLGSDVPWFKTGSLPAELFSDYAPNETFHAFKRIVNEYYLRLASDQGKNKRKYFAEKSNNIELRSRRFPRDAFKGAREIMITRDPRDLVCSRQKYFKQGDKIDILSVAEGTDEILRIANERRDDTIFIRYEDLVANAAATCAQLSGFLGVEIPARSGSEAESFQFKVHGTSKSPEASIGRWRTDLTSEAAALVEHRCRAFMERFGYHCLETS